MRVGTCPNCGRRNDGQPYDIGSGPELSCPSCEWCWSAEGQDLQPWGVHNLAPLVPRRGAPLDTLIHCQHCQRSLPVACDPAGDDRELLQLIAAHMVMVHQDQSDQTWVEGRDWVRVQP